MKGRVNLLSNQFLKTSSTAILSCNDCFKFTRKLEISVVWKLITFRFTWSTVVICSTIVITLLGNNLISNGYFRGVLSALKFDQQISKSYYKRITQIVDAFLLLINKDKIVLLRLCCLDQNALLVQEILIALYRTKTGTKKFSSETELKSHCKYIPM